MQKNIFFSILLFLATSLFASAQSEPNGRQFRTVEERVKIVMDKLTDFKLDKDKTVATDSAFTFYYKAQAKVREEMMGGGQMPDRDAMRSKMQKLASERDDKLKKIFTEEQFKKWKDEIEPTTRPQRPQGNNK